MASVRSACGVGLQPGQRVGGGGAVAEHFEVQVGAERAAGVAGAADVLADADCVADLDLSGVVFGSAPSLVDI